MLHGYRCKFRCGCRCRIGVVGLVLGTSNDSDCDDFDNPTIPDPMDTESRPNPTACNAPNDRVSTDAHPGSYHRSSTDQVQSYDPLSSPDLARRYDPCSSSNPARSLDMCSILADAHTCLHSAGSDHCANMGSELFLSPAGCYLV